MLLAQVILIAVAAYAAAGFLFAIAFVTVGVAKVDPVAHTAPVGFRLLILPGAALFWPLMLIKWRRSRVRSEQS